MNDDAPTTVSTPESVMFPVSVSMVRTPPTPTVPRSSVAVALVSEASPPVPFVDRLTAPPKELA